ncbi:MAG: sugar ABC transporter substrate-binding protein [Chloroflexi bacterium]|nr:sugar ABC transporter substrate-binding protein [Chloroflexota bacterium]MCI0574941.1 sugar ABC transporter substrate-binding protein [Chloroflexota bacterium]MCI0645851.1 sugar ABC transporter substrate-binding protein [Chloroflexota bacterium]MCI0725706.1 sugar ABC transporter substrate-binding protein [Chloroflexota bacterium]
MKQFSRSLFVLLFILVFTLAACGGGATQDTPEATEAPGANEAPDEPETDSETDTEPSGEPIHLSFVGWGGPEEQEVFQQLVETFNANNPDIVIEYTPMPDDYVTKLKTMVAGGTPPDIAYIPDGDFSFFVTAGGLVSLQEFVDTSEVIDPDNIWPSALGRYRYDAETKTIGSGDIYALPKDIGPTVLYINKDLFEAAGVPLPSTTEPLTWDEVVEIGQQITVDANGNHPGDEGFDINTVEVFGVGDLWFEDIVYGNGGQIVSDDGRTFVADMPETIEAVQFLSDLNHVHQVRPTSQQVASQSYGQLFETGKLAMTTCGRWCVTGYRDTLSFDWDAIPNPVGPSGKIYAADDNCSFGGWSGSVGLAIIAGSNGAENPEAAYRFIEFIAGPEGQTEQAALGFQIPNQIDLANSDIFLQPDQKPENAEVFIEAARCEHPGPWTRTPLYGQWFDDNWWQGVWPEVVVDGVKTAEEAITERKAAFQAGLDEAWASIEE